MINPLGTLGVPGGIGGTTLGLGIVISLNDLFTKQARQVENQLRSLDATSSATSARMEANLAGLRGGMAMATAGAAILATLSFPVREAVKFEEAIRRVQVIADDIDPKRLEKLTIDLSMMFPESPLEMAEALKTTVAAGIPDVEKAAMILKATNKLAVATQSDLERSIEGMTSLVNAYQMGMSDVYSPEEALAQYERAGAMIFESMKFGKFSDAAGITDFEAMSKQMGQILPGAGAMNMDLAELLSLWAASTLSGQNARKAATGMRQAFMDVLNRAAKPQTIPQEFINQVLTNTGFDIGGQGAIHRFVTENSFTALLAQMREYAGIRDTAAMRALLKTPRFQEQLKVITDTLPEDMSVEEAMQSSEAARDLMEALKDAGGVDPTKVNQIFKSIWGLTAVLPILTTQWDNFIDTQERMRNLSGEALDKAFKDVMNTVLKQWEMLLSKISTVFLMLGQHLLLPIRNALKVMNALLDTIKALVEAAPGVANLVMSVAASAGIFLSAYGVMIAFANLLRIADIRYKAILTDMKFFARWAKGGIVTTMLDVISIVGLVILASTLLRKAWEANFMGMRDYVMGWWDRIALTFQAVVELFKTLDETGSAFISMDLYNRLKDLGIEGFVGRLFALLYRVREFFKSFIQGFKDFFARLREGILAGVKRIGLDKIAEQLGLIDGFLSRLWVGTRENVEAWRKWGERLGTAAGALTLIAGALFTISSLGRAVGVLWSLLAPIRTLAMFLLTNPVGIALLTVGLALFAFKDQFISVFKGVREYLKKSFPGIVDMIDRIAYIIKWFPTMVRAIGLERSLKEAFKYIFGASLDSVVGLVWEKLKPVWDSIKQFVSGFAEGFMESFIEIVAAIKTAVEQVGAVLGPFLDGILGRYGIELKDVDWREVGHAFGRALPYIVIMTWGLRAGIALGRTILTVFGAIGNAFRFVMNIGKGLVAWFTTGFGARIVSIISSAAQEILPILGRILTSAFGSFFALGALVWLSRDWIIAALKNIVSWVSKTIDNIFGQGTWDRIIYWFENLWLDIKRIWGLFAPYVDRVFSDAFGEANWEAVKTWFATLLEDVKNLNWGGIWDGFKSAFLTVIGFIKDKFLGIWDAMLSVIPEGIRHSMNLYTQGELADAATRQTSPTTIGLPPSATSLTQSFDGSLSSSDRDAVSFNALSKAVLEFQSQQLVDTGNQIGPSQDVPNPNASGGVTIQLDNYMDSRLIGREILNANYRNQMSGGR